METTGTIVTPHKRFHFEFLIPLFFRPGATFKQVVQKRATWLTPMLVISLLVILRVMMSAPPVVATPVIPDGGPGGPYPGGGGGKGGQLLPLGHDATVSLSQQTGGGGGEGGGIDGGGIPPEASSGSITGNILPAIMATISVWAGWFLLSILLYVGMVINGSNNSFTETLNLVAWASLPIALHQIVIIIAVLVRPTLGDNPTGLAALASLVSGPPGMFLGALLKLVDVYLVWQTILIVVGLRQASPLALRRIIGITLAAMAIFLVLAALPSFLTAILAQLTTPVPSGYGYGG